MYMYMYICTSVHVHAHAVKTEGSYGRFPRKVFPKGAAISQKIHAEGLTEGFFAEGFYKTNCAKRKNTLKYDKNEHVQQIVALT